MTKILTEWITLCTAGVAIDGRPITEQMLSEAAELYDASEYCAVINYEHHNGNFGTVAEVRLGKDDKGRTILEGRISPNMSLFYQNKIYESKQFFSCEFHPDYLGSGKFYLTGLAITDTPASIGTHKLELSSNTTSGKNFFTTSEPVSLDFLSPVPVQADPLQQNSFMTMLSAFMHKVTGKSPDHQLFTADPNDNPEDEEEMKEVLAAINGLKEDFSTKFEEQQKEITKLSNQVNGVEPEKTDRELILELAKKVEELSGGKGAQEPKVEKTEKPAANSEEFAALAKGLKDLTAAFNKAMGVEHNVTLTPENDGEAEPGIVC